MFNRKSLCTKFFFQSNTTENLFINYLSRIHRDEDFGFVLRGFTRLLNNPLVQTYLPNSTKKVQFHQELLVFFWKMCDYNKVQFLFNDFRPPSFILLVYELKCNLYIFYL